MSSDFLAQLGRAAVEVAVQAAVQYAIGELTKNEPGRQVSFSTIKQTVPVRHFAYGRGRKPGAFAFWVSVDGYTVDVIAFCHGRIGGNWSFWFQDDAVTVGGDGKTLPGTNNRYGEFITVATRNGLPTETAYAEVMARTASWTAAHRGDHTASAAVICKMVKAEKMMEVYPNGQLDTSAAADWLCVHDWRDPTQDRMNPATWKWSDNPIVCWAHDEWARNACFWDHPTKGATERALASRTWARRFAPTLDILTEEANACDEIVLGEKRYRAFVWYTADTDRKSVREMFRRSCDGWMCERGDGAYVFRCGRLVVSPTVINDDVLVDLPMLRSGIAKSELVNDLQIRFTSHDHNHEIVDTTPWTDEASITRRGRKTQPLELPEVSSHKQARRIGKSIFHATNARHRGELRLDLDRIDPDLFNYRFHRLSTQEGSSAFRDMIVEFQRPEADYIERVLTVAYRSVTADRYSFTADDVGPLPGVVTNPTAGVIAKPTISNVTVFTDTLGSSSGSRLRVTLVAPARDDLTYSLRWKRTGADAWVDDAAVDAGLVGGFPVLETGFLPAVADLNVQVRAFGGGRFSDWSTTFGPINATVTSSPADDALNAWLDAVVVQPSPTQAARVRNLISSLVSAGVWAKLDALNVLAMHDAQAARTDLKYPARTATVVGAPVFTAQRGYVFDGVDDYLDTGWSPSTGPHMTASSISFGVYERTNVGATTYAAGSATAANNALWLIPRNVSGAAQSRAGSNGITAAGVTNSQGLNSIARTGTTFTHRRNGANLTTTAPSLTTGVLPTIPVFVGAFNDNGVAAGFRAASVAALYAASYLTPTEQLALFTALEAYLDAVGAGVV